MSNSGQNFFFCCFGFCLFRAAPAAYGNSQARGQIGDASAGLYHSHSNGESKPCLWATPQLMAMPGPQPTEQGRPGIEPTTSWFPVRFVNHCTTMGTPRPKLFNILFRNRGRGQYMVNIVCVKWLSTWDIEFLFLKSFLFCLMYHPNSIFPCMLLN